MTKTLVAILGLAACTPGVAEPSPACGSLATLDWLIGDWAAEGSQSTFHESWQALGPQTFEGTGIEQSKDESGVSGGEALRLVEMGGDVFYVSKVAHNELPVAFRLTGCEAGRFVFENAAHDFPRRLEYQRTAEDRLRVRVSDGADKGFTLDFARVPRSAQSMDAVLAAEDSRFAAMIAADAAALRRWLADELAYVHSTGNVEDREQMIESITQGRLTYETIDPVERRVIFSGPASAFVQGRIRFRVKAGATPLEFQARYFAVYALYEGAWRLRAWQSLRLP